MSSILCVDSDMSSSSSYQSTYRAAAPLVVFLHHHPQPPCNIPDLPEDGRVNGIRIHIIEFTAVHRRAVGSRSRRGRILVWPELARRPAVVKGPGMRSGRLMRWSGVASMWPRRISMIRSGLATRTTWTSCMTLQGPCWLSTRRGSLGLIGMDLPIS